MTYQKKECAPDSIGGTLSYQNINNFYYIKSNFTFIFL